MNKPDIKMLSEGGVGFALAYAILYALTAWLKVAPPIPEGEFMWFAVACGLCLTALFRVTGLRRRWEQEGGAEDAPAETAPAPPADSG
jgi:hypothetical protein